MGRRSKYDEYVKPHLDKIREWKSSGSTDKRIAEALGVSEPTFIEYKKKHSELKEVCISGTQKFCLDLRSELARIAFGHKLQTKKNYIRQDKDTGKKTQYTEITEKEVDGDIAAINLLLKNLDPDWSNDPQNLELRKQELELKKKIAEATNFDVEF